MVAKALQKSTLVHGRNESLAADDLPIRPGASLLYPGPKAKLLSAQVISELPPNERPSQLVVLDGTWHHAKTLFRDLPAIQNLPQFKLAPSEPGNYRIRLEPTDTSLSTVEAVVSALKSLEPETPGLDKLIGTFATMVDRQLAHPKAKYDGVSLEHRKQKKPNIPYALVYDPTNIVIAYGESIGGERSAFGSGQTRKPIYWVAQRLTKEGRSCDRFQVMIKQDDMDVNEQVLEHLGLEKDEFTSPISLSEFTKRWTDFLQPSDTLAVYNQSTLELLSSVGVPNCPSMVLKSVNVKPGQRNGALHTVLAVNKLQGLPPIFPGRAGRRLAGLQSFVQFLGELGLKHLEG